MIGYGKMSGCAISALSALAEQPPEQPKLSSLQIAELRNYSQVLVAKVMTILSQSGLVIGSRGPGGGYRLSRPPEEISLLEVVRVFEGTEGTLQCPFGPDYCGNQPPCPMHDRLSQLRDQYLGILEGCTLQVFADEFSA